MAGSGAAANLAAMNEHTSHTLVLRLWLDRDCLHGTVTAESGIRREFAGRLGLMGAIDDLLTPPAEAGETTPPAVPNAKEPS
jgi:hypothetical protein